LLSNDAQLSYNSNLEAILSKMQKGKRKEKKGKERLVRDSENTEEKKIQYRAPKN